MKSTRDEYFSLKKLHRSIALIQPQVISFAHRVLKVGRERPWRETRMWRLPCACFATCIWTSTRSLDRLGATNTTKQWKTKTRQEERSEDHLQLVWPRGWNSFPSPCSLEEAALWGVLFLGLRGRVKQEGRRIGSQLTLNISLAVISSFWGRENPAGNEFSWQTNNAINWVLVDVFT